MLTDFLNSIAEVQQITTSQTGMGGQKKNYSTRISALACRISKKFKGLNEVEQFGKLTIRNLWMLYCEATTAALAIIETDRIIFNSKTYDITGIYNPGQLDRHLEIELLEVR